MSETLHVGLLTPGVAAHGAGGVEVFNHQLREAIGDVEVIPEDGRQSPVGDLRRVGLDQPYRALRAARVLRRRHAEEPFDLVLGNGLWGWPVRPGSLGVPIVEVYHLTVAGLARNALTLRGDRLTTARVTAFFDRLAGVGKQVVAVSDRVLREVETFYGLRGRTIPNGVDTEAFVPGDRRDARDALGLPPDVPLGIFVGRTDHSKGFDILVEVARRLPEVLFVVVGGDGRAEGNLLPVGRIPHEQMPRWYAASDFLLCPSRYEGFNLTLVEALACDVPAVVSDAAYVLGENPSTCGIVVEGGPPERFVSAIRTVLAAPDAFAPRQSVASRYSLDRFRDSWRSLVRSLADPIGRGA